jgi:endonuclease/exonuclease/phosphatase family metal-dependent hydrolase
VLKVVVFNAAGGAKVGGIAACLSRPPLSDAGTILICEASWRAPRHRRVKFAAELAEALGMSFAFIPSFGRLGPAGEVRGAGNAIVCAQPLEDIRVIFLPGHQPRSMISRMPGVPAALTARVTAGGRRFTIGVAHLERRWDPAGRARQMSKLMEALDGVNPIVIGGDFNTTTTETDRRLELARAAVALLLNPRRFHAPQPYEPLFEHLSEHGFVIEGANVPGEPTFTPSKFVPPLWRPKLDWLAIRGLMPVAGSAAVVRAQTSRFSRRVSDHDFVVCEFLI